MINWYNKDGDEVLNYIVNGDKTWISLNTPETKRQLMEWHHFNFPTKPKKAKLMLSTRKVMAKLQCSGVERVFYSWSTSPEGRP